MDKDLTLALILIFSCTGLSFHLQLRFHGKASSRKLFIETFGFLQVDPPTLYEITEEENKTTEELTAVVPIPSPPTLSTSHSSSQVGDDYNHSDGDSPQEPNDNFLEEPIWVEEYWSESLHGEGESAEDNHQEMDYHTLITQLEKIDLIRIQSGLLGDLIQGLNPDDDGLDSILSTTGATNIFWGTESESTFTPPTTGAPAVLPEDVRTEQPMDTNGLDEVVDKLNLPYLDSNHSAQVVSGVQFNPRREELKAFLVGGAFTTALCMTLLLIWKGLKLGEAKKLGDPAGKI